MEYLIGIVLITVITVTAAWYLYWQEFYHTQSTRYHPDAVLIETVRSLGLRSREVFYPRGNGTLIITPEKVIFQRWGASQQLHISLKDMTEVVEVPLVTTLQHIVPTISYQNVLMLKFYTADAGYGHLIMRGSPQILFVLEDLRHKQNQEQAG